MLRSRDSNIDQGVDPAADFIIGSRIVAYHVSFAKVAGGAIRALLLSQLYFWSNTASVQRREGQWFWKTMKEIILPVCEKFKVFSHQRGEFAPVSL